MGDWQIATYSRKSRPPLPSTSKPAQNAIIGGRPFTQSNNTGEGPLTQNFKAVADGRRVLTQNDNHRGAEHIQSGNFGKQPTAQTANTSKRLVVQNATFGERPVTTPIDNSCGRASGFPSSVSQSDGTINKIAAKKKKKKTGTTEERRRKREEKKYNDMYGPRDTKVSIISPALMEKFKALSIKQLPKTPTLIDSASAAIGKELHNVTASSSSLEDDFPSLDAPLPKVPVLVRPSALNALECEVQPESPPPVQNVFPFLTKLESPVTISSSCDSTVTDTPMTKSVKKRANKPLVIDITEFLKPKEETQKAKSQKSLKAAQLLNNDRKIKKPGNILDSSGPIVINRGKIRKPKVKKPSPLKKAILTSRALRKVIFGARLDCGQSLVPEVSIKEELATDSSGSGFQMTEPSTTLFKADDKQQIKSEIEITTESEINHEDFFRALIEDTAREAQRKLVPVPPDIVTQVKIQMHKRKFRTYCDMYVTKELHGHVIALLKFLHRLQDKLYHTDPIKYSTKRRYVVGLKNVTSYLLLNKVRLIIIAPDLEHSSVEGGLDEKVEDLIQNAKERKVPYIFSGHRFILGYPIFVKSSVSAIGILDYQGAEELVKEVVSESKILRDNYQADFDQKVQELTAQMA